MEWLWITSSLLTLLTAGLMTLWLRRRQPPAKNKSAKSSRNNCRIILRSRAVPLLRSILRITPEHPDVQTVHAHAAQLMETLLGIRRHIRSAPPLPATADGEPRLLELARDLVDESDFSPDALLHALTTWHERPATSGEILCLPLCIAVAQCQRLGIILRAISTDAQEIASGRRLAHQMSKSSHASRLLEKNTLRSSGLASLHSALQDQESLQACMDDWLQARGLSGSDLTANLMRRQMQLADEIRRIIACLDELSRMDWPRLCREADHTHALLLKEPGAFYPRMTVGSQQLLRLQIDRLSRLFRIDAAQLIRQAFILCQEAAQQSRERYIGHWLQGPGLRMLLRELPSRRIFLKLFLPLPQEQLHYALLWIFGITTGFLFLHSRNPVFMLPFFAWVNGCVIRHLLGRLRQPALAEMSLADQEKPLRILVVLPAMMADAHEAIRSVRQLKTASQSLAAENTDFLLIGDFAPSITAVTKEDASILHAAASAIAALNAPNHIMYFHRGRVWDEHRHCYARRAGNRGAVTAICRLIAQGECEDVIACSTAEPAAFERRYDYVLALSQDRPPTRKLLRQLLQVMIHPSCAPYPGPDGSRGHAVLSPCEDALFTGVGLIRPDAYLEATDGLAPTHLDAASLCGELAGHAAVPGAHLAEICTPFSWEQIHQRAMQAWQLAGWQLTWVQTPSGLVNNPLRWLARFRLREPLRRTLTPLGQCALLLWAVLTQSLPLLLLALLAPESGRPLRRKEHFIHLICSLSLLPTRVAVNLRGLADGLRSKKHPDPDFTVLEVWVQGIAATLFCALTFVHPGFSVPALALGVLFACFPLAHRFMDVPLQSDEGLTSDHITLLETIAASTWQFFSSHMTENTRHLPPASVQFHPAANAEMATSPEAIAGGLIACICAKDLGILSADAAAKRLRCIAESIAALPMPFGLPCRRYALPSLTVLDAGTNARYTGYLFASLMAAAQALRTWLPELSQEFADLSSSFTQQLKRFDLSLLYDAASGRFRSGLDEHGQAEGYVETYTDEALLLSFCAITAQAAPPEQLAYLRRTCAALPDGDVPLSMHGAASEHLLAGLFLSLDETKAHAFIRTMIRQGRNGIFGQDHCRYFDFDPALNYRQDNFGIPEIALQRPSARPVFAPFAAALCLPFLPREACDALAAFHRLGTLGPKGFCDAVDMTNGTSPVGLHDAWHQGIILASAAHMLADAPLRRYFCALPETEAFLNVLDPITPVPLIPRLPVHKTVFETPVLSERDVSPLTTPSEAHLMGSEDFRLIADASANTQVYDGGIPLTRRHSFEDGPQGIQFYLCDEDRIYHLGDPGLLVNVTFLPGEVQYQYRCGSLKVELVHLADSIHRRVWQIITITNLSTRDRMVDVADFLLADLGASPDTLEASRPEKQCLTLRARGRASVLHHQLSCSVPPISLSACTDSEAFLGRNRTLRHPASLEEPMHDQVCLSPDPCLSFRAKLNLGGRGQVCLWFSTTLQSTDLPQMSDLAGIRKLAALQHRAIAQAAGLSAGQELLASQMSGLIVHSAGEMALIAENDFAPGFLQDLSAMTRWFKLRGMPLTIHASGSSEALAALQGAFDVIHLHPLQPTHPFALPVFHTDRPLAEQAEAMYHAVQPPVTRPLPPLPALLPQKKLQHTSTYGGFDPETSDYIIQLEPRQTTPIPWENAHSSRYFRETVDESGFRAPFHEQVYIQLTDGTLLSPWSQELPRAVRMGAGETRWEAWSDKLDLRLTASCLPGHRCGLRVLRVRNTSSETITLTISICAHLAPGDEPLESAPGLVMTNRPNSRLQNFLAGDGWTAWTCATPPFAESLNQQSAQLSDTLHLTPHTSCQVRWIAGFARHAEDASQALTALKEHSAVDHLRTERALWANRLNKLTFTTPEDTLNLMMNRILPQQAFLAEGLDSVPALSHLLPAEAKRALLKFARRAETADDWALLSLYTAAYVRTTEDADVWEVYLPRQEASLYSCCAQELQSVPLDRQGLPFGEDSARRCFLFVLAAKALSGVHPSAALESLSQRLLSAAEDQLWQEGFYAAPLQLDIQNLACAALGTSPRTRQSIQRCWDILYDRPHGLLRQQEPTDAAPLPGLPENGGMITRSAAFFLHALLLVSRTDEAFELLRALNPLHHTDDALRQETFRCSPYQLHGGMCAAPLEAGRGVTDGGNEAAALLYSVVLTDILGFHQEGRRIRIRPCIPPDWEEYAIKCQYGASTWHISVNRRVQTMTIDGIEAEGDSFLLRDDGRIHQVSIPLK